MTSWTTKSLLLFDADGTLRRCTIPRQPCPNAPDQWELLPRVREVLSPLPWGPDLTIGIVSNQGGIGLGFLHEDVARSMLDELVVAATGRELEAWPKPIVALCPHAPADGCLCRKPWPTMLIEMMRAHGRTPAQTLFVGDQETDRQAAVAAGCEFLWAHEAFGDDPTRSLEAFLR